MQAHNKKQLEMALKNVRFIKQGGTPESLITQAARDVGLYDQTDEPERPGQPGERR